MWTEPRIRNKRGKVEVGMCYFRDRQEDRIDRYADAYAVYRLYARTDRRVITILRSVSGNARSKLSILDTELKLKC